MQRALGVSEDVLRRRNDGKTVGGANWGNLGNDGGISSYDYAASVREDRRVDRSKYSEIKLVANFIRASEGALALAVPDNATASVAVGPGGQPLDVGRLSVPGPTADGQARTQLFVVRHRNISVATNTSYTLSVRSSRGSAGIISIPRQGGSLTLHGRDAKIHVVDYDAGGVEIVYCTADIFTWKRQPDGRVLLIVYGRVGEHHEIGVAESSLTKGTGNQSDSTPSPRGNTLISDGIISFSWEVNEAEKREMIRLGSLDVMLLGKLSHPRPPGPAAVPRHPLTLSTGRSQARTFWVVDVANYPNSTAKAAPTDGAVIVKGGYLIRSASLNGGVLHVEGDFDHTATLEFIGVPPQATALSVNGNATSFTTDPTTGFWKTTVLYWQPAFTLPDLGSPNHEWRYIDTLPELQPGYDDSKWRRANLTKTPNIKFPITTPVSLYAADYGFHSGYFVYRGTFVGTGGETALTLATQGGLAFASAVWLDGTLLGSWPGEYRFGTREATFNLTQPLSGRHNLTVLIDNHGHDLNLVSDGDIMKTPRGIMNYNFTTSSGQQQPTVEWKLTGNLGGEDYVDVVRGPLNEGGLYAERQGFHQPRPPIASWAPRHPVTDGVDKAGVGFFMTKFTLDMPRGYDVPLYVVFSNSSGSATGGSGSVAGGNYYRVHLYVNGWQFGRYISHLGPQDAFHMPEGILDYHSENWVAISLFALQPGGAKLAGISLTTAPGTPGSGAIMTAYQNVTLVEPPAWKQRAGAY